MAAGGARAAAGDAVVGVLDSVGEFAVAAFRKGLGEMGHAQGRNVAIDVRTTEQYDLAALAAELVRRRVAVIAAIGGPSAPAAKAVTAAIPVVFAIGGDPVELGLVTSLNRPGGNVTGVTFFTAQLLQKQVGLLHELVPRPPCSAYSSTPTTGAHRPTPPACRRRCARSAAKRSL